MDKRTGKLMTKHKALHLRDDVNKPHVSGKKEEEDSLGLKIASRH